MHLPELVDQFGSDQAIRRDIVAKLMGSDTNPYLAIYEWEPENPNLVLGQMDDAAQAGKLTQSEPQDLDTSYVAVFRALRDPVKPG